MSPGPACGCRTSINTPNVIQWCATHAAAADLLEALEAIRTDIGPRAWCDPCDEEDCPYAAAVAAIARARGEA